MSENNTVIDALLWVGELVATIVVAMIVTYGVKKISAKFKARKELVTA